MVSRLFILYVSGFALFFFFGCAHKTTHDKSGSVDSKIVLSDSQFQAAAPSAKDSPDIQKKDDVFEIDIEQKPLLVLVGKEYGAGSSRDWAAKGTRLLGIKAVITESYERIHRSNLVGMGVLPLVFKKGDNYESLGLDGTETYSITGIENMIPRKMLQVKAVKKDGSEINFEVMARLDTEIDIDYFENGGILQYVLRKILKRNTS